MELIASLHPKLIGPEIAVVHLSEEDRRDFYKDALRFVNEHKIFEKKVRSVEVASLDRKSSGSPRRKAMIKTTTSADTYNSWLAVIIHRPACNADALCVPLDE